jgi:hypothetical protein
MSAVLVLAGCAPAGPSPAAGENPTEAQTEVNPSGLTIGDCTGPLPDGEVPAAAVIPCDSPHYWELYSRASLGRGAFPADIATVADEYCTDAFADYAGVPWDATPYELTFLYPATAQAWATADHEILCFAGRSAGDLTNGLRDG